jgi:oligoendopeptidase F
MDAADTAHQWDLTDLYAGPDDPAIAGDQQRTERLVAAFGDAWRGRVATLTGDQLAEALTQLEAIQALARRPGHFADLRFSQDSEDPERRAAVAAAQAWASGINQGLAFFFVELKDVDEDALAALPDRAALTPYEHWLGYERQFAPHTLSEDAEKTSSRKDVTGKTAWVNLYMQTTSAIRYSLEVDGEVQELTRAEVSAYLSRADRPLRKAARDALHDGFLPHRDVLTFVFNTLFEDHRLDMAERGYDDVLDFSLKEDQLSRDVVLNLLDTTTAAYPTVHRYHQLRKRVLALPDYGYYDLKAPAFGDEPEVPWDEAVTLVRDAFAAFSPRTGAWVDDYLARRRVDVFPRPGKSTGAFCSPGYPPTEPWVLMNYAGRLDDVFTLAHELGHALHFTEALQQTPLNYWTGRCVAETASVFAELWLHEHLMTKWTDPARRRQLLDRQIQGAIGTAFHQVAYVNWERAAHAARAEGVVAADAFAGLWREETERLLGPAVSLDEQDAWRWITIPHFVFARFYCYSYAFGKLLTLALHNRWREQGDAFVDDYLGLLGSGGSRTPVQLVAGVGLDLQDPGFWGRGLAEVDRYLDQLTELAD